MSRLFPFITIPAPSALAAGEEMVNPFRSSVTPLAVIVMAVRGSICDSVFFVGVGAPAGGVRLPCENAGSVKPSAASSAMRIVAKECLVFMALISVGVGFAKGVDFLTGLEIPFYRRTACLHE